jgi:EmrB/QacA subfamily drug resistance transporter
MLGEQPGAGRAHAVSRRQTLAATVAAAGIVQLPTAAIVVAIPTIHSEFGASIAELQWTVTAFYIPFASLLIASGRIADIFGRRLTFFIGAALFAAGSLAAAVAPGVDVLIAGIAVCGMGGALLMPSSMAILTNVFTGTGRGMAVGMWGAATELISGVGVVVGGVLTDKLDWRWIFVVNIVVAAVMVLLALRGSPESRDPTVPRAVDFPGVILIASALTALTLALIEGSTWGWGSAATIGLLIGSAVLFAAFVVVQRRSEHPLVDFSFFRHRNFSGSMVVIFVMDFSFGALLFFLPLYFQELLGYSPLEAGVLLLPLTGLMVVASPLGGRVAATAGPRLPIVVGLASMAVAIYLISRVSLDTDYADLWAPTALMGFGVGLALTPMNLAAMNAISREHHGAASGLLVTLSGLGATLGVAATGAIFQQLQTDRTVSLADDRGVTVTEAQARELEGLLAGTPGAQHTLDQIAGGKAGGVREAVREAFVDALGTSLKLSAALVVLGLLLTVLLMRRSAAADAEPTPPILAPPIRPAPRRTTG